MVVHVSPSSLLYESSGTFLQRVQVWADQWMLLQKTRTGSLVFARAGRQGRTSYSDAEG